MRTFTRNQWLLLRMALYLAIVVALYLWRGGIDWQRARVLMSAGEPARELRLAGRDLAPALVDSLLSAYARDYPEQGVALLPGGADLALEHLLNGRCELAFQTSPPAAPVQALARGSPGRHPGLAAHRARRPGDLERRTGAPATGSGKPARPRRR